jgi:tRNA dimethylallyltransferase
MIDWPRELLYARIEARVDAMLAEGLLDEVRRLYEAKRLLPNTTAGQAIGYKEFSAYLRGETDYETAVADLKTATRRYAKRQLTWFLADPHLIRLSALSPSGRLHTAEELAEEAITIYNENNF